MLGRDSRVTAGLPFFSIASDVESALFVDRDG